MTIRIDDMDEARMLLQGMDTGSAERLLQACVEKARVRSMAARIAAGLGNRKEDSLEARKAVLWELASNHSNQR